MLEAAVAFVGLFLSVTVCRIYGPYMHQQRADDEAERKVSILAVWGFGAVALYCLVRLVHLAWITPIPYVSSPETILGR
jgi:hypothetical protein